MKPAISWEGVFPAVTTQFREDYSLDIEATAKVMEGLIRDGVSGLIVCGTVGENCSLTTSEKIQVMEAGKSVAAGRVPVICGIAEFTSEFATLTDCDTIVCFKESSGDTRRFIDLRNKVGDRFVMFAGLDDVVLESIAMGAQGWVSGMSNAFPREGETLFRLARAGRYAEAMKLYEWFMPLLHLDARPDLVQCIKLCEHIMGRGTWRTRPPRLALLDHEKAEVKELMAVALDSRPELPDVGLKATA